MDRIRKRTAELLQAQRPNDPWGRVIDLGLIVLIFANVVLIILETVPELGLSHKDSYAVLRDAVRDVTAPLQCPHCGGLLEP